MPCYECQKFKKYSLLSRSREPRKIQFALLPGFGLPGGLRYIVLVNETWLHRDVESSELLHSGYSIFSNDRKKRRAGGVLIAAKTSAFKSVTEYPLADELWSQQPLIRRFYYVLVTGPRTQTLVGYIYLTSF